MIEGKNINLRLVEEADLEQIARWRNEPEISKLFFNTFPIATSGQKKWYVENILFSEKKKLFIITTKDGKSIGTLGLDDIDFKNQNAEYGNMLIGDKEYLNKGYAKDAILTILRFAFEELNVHRIYLKNFEHNQKALTLYEKCGFRKEGILRDSFYTQGEFKNIVIMAILRHEFMDMVKGMAK